MTTTTGVDTTHTTNATVNTGQQQLSSDYNTFLQLLTAQLKNQDPLSPMDTNNFTQQLVMMNGVQQQLQTNALLQTLVNQSSAAGPAVNLIGKQVQAASPTIAFSGGQANWTYDLGGDAASATMTITDSANKVVWSGQAPDLSQGKHSFTWDGTTLSGGKVTSGDYTLNIKANDSGLRALSPNVFVQGVVTGVESSTSGTQLTLSGGTAVNYTNVTQVQNATTN
jgi:flagellar basal-body rod modification protein FlgD